MLPLLQLAADGKEHSINDAAHALADVLRLSDADRAEKVPSGASRVRKRTYWAKLYLS
ncbi:MAG: winged helix-turn-helix domain-containing protein [Vulcanimicrobiaceae bacterium]